MPRGPIGLDAPKSNPRDTSNLLERGTLDNRQVKTPRSHTLINSKKPLPPVVDFELNFPPKNTKIKCDSFKWLLMPEVRVSSIEVTDYRVPGIVAITIYCQVKGEIVWEVEHELIDGQFEKKSYSIKFDVPIPFTEYYWKMVLRGGVGFAIKAAASAHIVGETVQVARVITFIVNNWPMICRSTGELSKLLDETKLKLRLQLLPPLIDPATGALIA